MGAQKRIGIFGWGVVAPKCENIDAFAERLKTPTTWLEPFREFGPSNFLVGYPKFDFKVYKPWVDERFEPRKFSQLDRKMGPNVKHAIGAFIQSLEQNPGIEKELQDLGDQAHVYVGTGLGDLSVIYETSVHYHNAQRRWNKFWCRDEHNAKLAAYRNARPDRRVEIREEMGAPDDPRDLDPLDDWFEEAVDAWSSFWVHQSEGLHRYLERMQEIEAEGLNGDVEKDKSHVIRRKMAARKRINKEQGCPTEPWAAVDAKLLWNIPNIPSAQITMLGQLTGPGISPMAACAGFGTSLQMAISAIRGGQARAAVIGMTDAAPHPLTVGGFFDARVVSSDGEVSKPFTDMKGTHIAGGACVWIVGDRDYMMDRGFRPLGLEILDVSLTSDADHIITPSNDGPLRAMANALRGSGLTPSDVDTWDLHATATPGDWTELQAASEFFPESTLFTARKGIFGHGMSACGGWELTAQHLGLAEGRIDPIPVTDDEFHPQIRGRKNLVREEPIQTDAKVAGKINMGVGGFNSCVICRRWEDEDLLLPDESESGKESRT